MFIMHCDNLVTFQIHMPFIYIFRFKSNYRLLKATIPNYSVDYAHADFYVKSVDENLTSFIR